MLIGSPTLQLLLTHIQVFLGTEEPDLLQKRIVEYSDWLTFHQLMVAHRVLPIVYQTLTIHQLLSHLPQNYQQYLKQSYCQSVQKSSQLTAETLKLLQAIQQANISVIPLKGPLLSQHLHQSFCLRAPGDIDLLIQPPDYPIVLQLLQNLGYQYAWDSCNSWNPKQRATYLQQQGEITVVSHTKKIAVDLHIRWSRNPQLFPLPFNVALHKSVPLPQQKSSISVLSFPHQLFYLSTHGAAHGWTRLSWLTDIATIIQSFTDSDWQQAEQQIDRWQIQAPIAQALSLSQTLFNLPMNTVNILGLNSRPDHLFKSAQANITIPEPNSIPGNLSTPPLKPIILWQDLVYELSLKSNLKYKWYCIKRLFFSAKDWEILQLPESLWFLYIFLRPIFYLYRVLSFQFLGQHSN